MLMPSSSEFVALCRSQVALLTQEMGVAFTVVYLTQELGEGRQSQLVPIVAYPETAATYQFNDLLQLTAGQPPTNVSPSQNNSNPVIAFEPGPDALLDALDNRSVDATGLSTSFPFLAPSRQMVLPLMHENVVLGILVVGRSDRTWQRHEQPQLEAIANTLALACVLDQRYQWLEREHRQQQIFQAQQHDLIDNLLHQFRNSLTALQTFGKLLLRRLLPGDTNRTIADNIVRETSRLKELSQQLEQVSKASLPVSLALPAGHVTDVDSQVVEPESELSNIGLSMAGILPGATLTIEPCQVSDVLQPLFAAAQTIAQDQGLRFVTAIPEHCPLVQANAQALGEVMNNLIENALKYTPDGGQVSVIAQAKGQWVEIAVTDTGVGIPPEDLPHLFERYFRGIQANTEIPGSGLGLAIARSLIEQMHGEIQVFSPARKLPLMRDESTNQSSPRPGSTFVVRLPVAENSALHE